MFIEISWLSAYIPQFYASSVAEAHHLTWTSIVISQLDNRLMILAIALRKFAPETAPIVAFYSPTI